MFHDWSNIINERHIGLILCGTNDIIMAANEQRPPFFLLIERKKNQCRSLINNIYHNFRSIICFFCLS